MNGKCCVKNTRVQKFLFFFMERREPKIKVKLTDRANGQIRNSSSMRKFNKGSIDTLKTYLSTQQFPPKWSKTQKTSYKIGR